MLELAHTAADRALRDTDLTRDIAIGAPAVLPERQ